jgi:predicted DNA-binding transcriptional regulator YafY
VRASRLVNLLLLLQARGGLTAAELARELEVSIRTVHRDVEELSAAGVPIFAERGPHGGIRLVDGYRTRLTGMTADEAEALFLSGLPGPAAQLGLGTVVAAAQLKVMAALPPELRSRASRIVERFHLDAAGWFQADEPVPHLATLSAAVWDGSQVVITYDRGHGGVERTVAPLGLVLKGGVWYVVGLVDGQIRTYRGSRILAASPLAEPVARPPDFDLAAYWAETSAAYEREAPTVDVVIRVRESRLTRLRTIVGERAMEAATHLDGPDPDGWITFRLQLPWPDEVPGQLLGVGSGLEVVGPADIRDRLLATAERVVGRYRGTDRVTADRGDIGAADDTVDGAGVAVDRSESTERSASSRRRRPDSSI